MKLKKALYGTLKAALLFWKTLTAKLVSMGLVVNPYDECVANKVIGGKQCTILWHVDDIKVSHVDSQVVSEVLGELEKEYGKEAPLTVSRGKKHNYLGMVLDFSTRGAVQITIYDYIKNMLAELPAVMDGESRTPAALHLFEVNEEAVKLSEKDAQFFHHYVAKLLFLCKRARPDIQTAVAFLSTRVQNPDTDDYKKLTRTMRYLRGTSGLGLTLKADNIAKISWWVDASFAVHPNMRSHTGVVLTLGGGAVYGSSTKQKLNTRSSTEAELVGVNDALPQVLWTRQFLNGQGYGDTDSVIY